MILIKVISIERIETFSSEMPLKSRAMRVLMKLKPVYLSVKCYSLDQGSPNVFVRGPYKPLLNSPRTGHLTQYDCFG